MALRRDRLFILSAVWLGVRDFRTSPPAAERGQGSVLAIGIIVPGVVASVTDGLLPMLGIAFPSLGSVSVAWVGIVGAASAWHYGYSPLVPTAFNGEILDTLPEGIAMAHVDGRIRSSSDALGALAGRSRRALDGLPIQDWPLRWINWSQACAMPSRNSATDAAGDSP